MSSNDQRHAAELSWLDNDVPVSVAFDDAYFAYSDGWAETDEVFISGNDLPARWSQGAGLSIGELGFGTGLNFLATLHAWRSQTSESHRNARLSMTSFELTPLDWEVMARVFARWPALSELAVELEPQWSDVVVGAVAHGRDWSLKLVVGDARTTVDDWDGVVDAWYLDGFSPSKNPELWSEDLLRSVYARTRPGGTFSTYTAAGWVRRALANAGFEVERVKGFDRKRERLQGYRADEVSA
ncbi:MAG: tRNA (5-methylaminomethyl-2-thiouridine)(34)-methyltransferase MnmD [Pseudomonadota bacterium]